MPSHPPPPRHADLRRPLAILVGLLAMATTAHAHKPSDSYLTLDTTSATKVRVSWHVALRDLDSELHLDADDDGRLTWGEVRPRWAELGQFARQQLTLSTPAGPCTDGPLAPAALMPHTDGQYAVLQWTATCPQASTASTSPAQQLTVHYHLFALSDPTHRGLVRGPGNGAVVVMGPAQPQHTWPWPAMPEPTPATTPSTTSTAQPAPLRAMDPTTTHAVGAMDPLTTLMSFIHEGMAHIAAGADHILFLVTLMLVAVWRRPDGKDRTAWWPVTTGWQARQSWRSTVGESLRLVTAFTIAHSLTLALAASGVLSPPSRWVESLIALSVLVAAIDNLVPLLHAPRWIVVFAFGLVHGFGFAGPLQDLGLQRGELLAPLLGFNVGVELGQLAIVALVLPLAYALRHTRIYRHLVVAGGSTAVAMLALIWLIERALNTQLTG